MYSLEKLFTYNKHQQKSSNITEKWKEDEYLVLNNRCKFDIQYLGTSEVNEPTDFSLLCGTLKDQIGNKKMIKAIMNITVYSLVIFEKSTNRIIIDQPLKSIVLCSSHPGIPYTFFYITNNSILNIFQLSGFISMKEVSDRIINAILFALQIFCEKESESSSTLIDYQKHHFNEQDQSFKQTSLVERYQDPQSSIVISNPRIPISKTFTDLKSIPRPKPLKKNQSNLFPDLNPGTLFKQNQTNSTSETNNSKIGYSSHENLENFVLQNLDFKGYSENSLVFDNDLQNPNQINDSFRGNMPTFELQKLNSMSNFENESIQSSKYDIFKKIDKPLVTSGWSDEIAGIDKPKLQPTNATSSDFDEFLTSFLENINLTKLKDNDKK